MIMSVFKVTILTIIATVLFTACGGGGGNGDGDDPEVVTMQKGKPYEMQSGQAIVKKSDDAQVLLETNIETGITTAVLQQGSAVIE